jgi:hypothetical protein
VPPLELFQLLQVRVCIFNLFSNIICHFKSKSIFSTFMIIQDDFENCADILTCDKTPQKVMIEPIMPYTIFFEKRGLKVFQKKFRSY